jgi:Stage II sporulation protein M
MKAGMRVDDLVLVQGMAHTRATLAEWNREPWRVLARWTAWSFLVAMALLAAVYVVAKSSTPDLTRLHVPGVHSKTTPADVGHVLFRNSLVLALHAMACVAGFIAGSSLPISAAQRSGVWRWVHEKAGPLAIAFVVGATLFSLSTQAYVLGGGAAQLAEQFRMTPSELIVTVLPHALPELTALFLPLAAWLIASRRGQWHQLLAATFVTVAIAVPVLVVSAVAEVYVWPELLVDAGALNGSGPAGAGPPSAY